MTVLGVVGKWSFAARTLKKGKTDEPYVVEVSSRRIGRVRTLAIPRSFDTLLEGLVKAVSWVVKISSSMPLRVRRIQADVLNGCWASLRSGRTDCYR